MLGNKKRSITIFLLAILGFIATIELTHIYFEANFNPYALPSFCSMNSTIDCDGVAQTTFSQFLGIPLALWGMFFYTFIIFLLFVDKLKTIKGLSLLNAFKTPQAYIASLGYIAFSISMILAIISLFVIKKICIMCVLTYFIDLFIAIAATDFKQGIWSNFKTSYMDFVEDLKEKRYRYSLLLALAIAASILCFTTISNCFTPQVKRVKEFKSYQKMTDNNPFKAYGNTLGDKDAKVVVYVYTDYRCPICQTYNVILSRAAAELNNVLFIHKNYPLDKTCNRTIQGDFHKDACLLAKYSIAAENQGKLWEMNTELFESQPQDEKEILELAKRLGIDTEKLKIDAYSQSTDDKLKQDIEDGININLAGTPAVVINGKIHVGIKPYYELKDLLIKAGATEK